MSVYIASYPGTGSDWVEELVTVLLNDFNFEYVTKSVEDLKAKIIKTEVTYDLLENTFENGTQNKIIYVVRNPKQTCISLYHLTNDRENKLESFCNLFLNGQVFCGSYWEHVSSYCLNRQAYQILFIQYEYIERGLPQAIKKVADFLKKPVTECEILSLVHHLCIPNLQKRPRFRSLFKMYDTTLPSDISKRFTQQSESYQMKIGFMFTE